VEGGTLYSASLRLLTLISKQHARDYWQTRKSKSNEGKVNNLPPSLAFINSSTGTVMVFEVDSALGSDMIAMMYGEVGSQWGICAEVGGGSH
jgi:hypothetical protein